MLFWNVLFLRPRLIHDQLLMKLGGIPRLLEAEGGSVNHTVTHEQKYKCTNNRICSHLHTRLLYILLVKLSLVLTHICHAQDPRTYLLTYTHIQTYTRISTHTHTRQMTSFMFLSQHKDIEAIFYSLNRNTAFIRSHAYFQNIIL